MNQSGKAFGLWRAVFLGIGSMVGAGIFIVIGQAGALAGNIVWLSFVLGGMIALLSGYSLAKLAIAYPSRGGMVEYLVQAYGVGLFSGTMGVLFYFSQLVVIAAVAKSFGTYSATFLTQITPFWVNAFAVGVVLLFMLINLVGASVVAKSESVIVAIKVGVLSFFAVATLFTVDPERLSVSEMPPISGMLFAIGLTFFAYQGFSVITNTVEDMENPKQTMLRAMVTAILMVAALYVVTSLSVLGNLSLQQVIETKEYALAEAAKPLLGEWGFKVMAVTALLATASAINATLYAVTDIGYTLAKEGSLPEEYEYNVIQSYEGLIISTALVMPMIVFFNLDQITTVAAMVVLIVQGIVHMGHLNLVAKTGARKLWIVLAFLSIFGVVGLTMYYSYGTMPEIAYYLLIMMGGAFVIEFSLRYFNSRIIQMQS